MDAENEGDDAEGVDGQEADEDLTKEADTVPAAITAAGGADWGDQEEDEEEDKAADDAPAGPETEAGEAKAVRVKREPFEVPMQGQFWGHDDRFDEAEAAAHEE